MLPDGVTDEQRAFVKRATDAEVQMRAILIDAATAYIALDPAGRELDEQARDQALEWVERIAVDWREAELAEATDPPVEDELSAARIHRLLAAIQDSLILALTGGPAHHSGTLSANEVTNRIADLAEDGAWESAYLRPRLATPEGNPDELARRFDELELQVLKAVGEAATVFPSIAPDEPDLDEAQVAGCREHLVVLAACGRELDRERDLVDALVERRDLRPSIGMLHSMVQALVLRLADDPERRAQATPLQDLATRYHPVLEDWKTWI